jgi:hypothetical protein
LAKVSFNIPRINQIIADNIDAAMVLIGNQGVTWASDQWRSNGYSPRTRERQKTGNLVNSISYSTDKEQGSVRPMTKRNIGGTQLQKPETRFTCRVGTNVVYAARVEFGFTGKDSLGRYFNQPAKSYLRAGILPNRDAILSIIDKAIRG